VPQARAPDGSGKPVPGLEQRKHLWGSRDLNPGPTDYESDRNPHGTIPIRRFVRGSLTLADSEEQRFSFLCATNVPQDLRGSWSAGAWIDHHRITKSGPVFANYAKRSRNSAPKRGR
jgi:hypothetical protein